MSFLFIAAQNYKHAYAIAANLGLANSRWRYLDEGHQLKGYQNPLVLFAPGCEKHPNAKQIVETYLPMCR